MNKKKDYLGKSLIRDHKKKSNFVIKDGFRHSCDLPDGRDWARLNLHSVTEQTSLDHFLDETELAANEFEEEFSNIKIVEQDETDEILTEAEKLLIASAQEKNRNLLSVPRRPFWTLDTPKEELDAKEKLTFLEWRRNLSKLQEEEHINITPYEKNLEIWRQLWRVIERSHVLVQIVDARNPLFFRCPDLEAYVKEVDSSKLNVLLLNKADFLTESERECWCEYFDELGIKIIFFSALQEMEVPPEEETKHINEITGEKESNSDEENDVDFMTNNTKVLSKDELIDFFKKIGLKAAARSFKGAVVGLVGYPNVGKSSTINALLMSKKVSVSATPGKTKHFQTIVIDKDLCLCDCPGLVFPNFVSSKAEMVISGVLSADNLNNYVPPITLLTNMIPRRVLEATYLIIIPPPPEGRDPNSPPTADEFLDAFGYSRGYLSRRALPDNARSAKIIVKDYINGKLLYCYAPPGFVQEEFHKFEVLERKRKSHKKAQSERDSVVKPKMTESDKRFFSKTTGGIHYKNAVPGTGPAPLQPEGANVAKPWRLRNNYKKREKLRRVYKNPYA